MFINRSLFIFVLPWIFSIITAIDFFHLFRGVPNVSAALMMVVYTVSISMLKSSIPLSFSSSNVSSAL